MRAIQNADGHVGLTAREYPIAAATAVSRGMVVKLSGGLVVAAAAAETGAVLGIAAENHPGTPDTLNPRANGGTLLVYDNPGVIFECPAPAFTAASGSATTVVFGSGQVDAAAADDTFNGSVIVLESKAEGSSNTDAVGVKRAVSDYAKTGTTLTVASGGTAAAGDRYRLYPPVGSTGKFALDSGRAGVVLTTVGAAALRVVGHDYDRRMLRCMAAVHTLGVEN